MPLIALSLFSLSLLSLSLSHEAEGKKQEISAEMLRNSKISSIFVQFSFNKKRRRRRRERRARKLSKLSKLSLLVSSCAGAEKKKERSADRLFQLRSNEEHRGTTDLCSRWVLHFSPVLFQDRHLGKESQARTTRADRNLTLSLSLSHHGWWKQGESRWLPELQLSHFTHDSISVRGDQVEANHQA